MEEIKEAFENDEDIMFDNQNIYTMDKKLEQLKKFQETLLEQDRNAIDNITGAQRICRMQGSTA